MTKKSRTTYKWNNPRRPRYWQNRSFNTSTKRHTLWKHRWKKWIRRNFYYEASIELIRWARNINLNDFFIRMTFPSQNFKSQQKIKIKYITLLVSSNITKIWIIYTNLQQMRSHHLKQKLDNTTLLRNPKKTQSF